MFCLFDIQSFFGTFFLKIIERMFFKYIVIIIVFIKKFLENLLSASIITFMISGIHYNHLAREFFLGV